MILKNKTKISLTEIKKMIIEESRNVMRPIWYVIVKRNNKYDTINDKPVTYSDAEILATELENATIPSVNVKTIEIVTTDELQNYNIIV